MTISQKLSIAYSSFKTAHRFIKTHNLWRFIIIPGVINLILFVGLMWWVLGNADLWVDYLFSFEATEDDSWLFSFFLSVIGVIKFLFSWLIKILIVFIWLSIYKNITLFLNSPFIAYLVEVVDQKHKGVDYPFNLQQFIKDTVRGIVIATRSLILEGLCVVALLIMALVPVVNLVQPILMWLVSAYFLGFSMLDYSLELKRLDAKSSINYIKKHKSLATGIGSVFQLMFLVPIIGWMFAPTYSAVAAYFAVEELEKLEV